MLKQIARVLTLALVASSVAPVIAHAEGEITVDNSTGQNVVFYVTCGGEEKDYTLDTEHEWHFSDCESPKIWIGTEGHKGDKEYDLEGGHHYTVVLENGVFDINEK